MIATAPAALEIFYAIHKAMPRASLGRKDREAFEDFKARGVTAQQMTETIADIAHCTLTNDTNRLADTDFDDFLENVSV